MRGGGGVIQYLVFKHGNNLNTTLAPMSCTLKSTKTSSRTVSTMTDTAMIKLFSVKRSDGQDK